MVATRRGPRSSRELAEAPGGRPGEAAAPGWRNDPVDEMVAIVVVVSLLAMSMFHETAFALLAERIPALR